jgi:hypothetical protein
MEKSELTPKEREAMDLTAKLAGVMREIIGNGPCAAGDWNEVAHSIHDIQAPTKRGDFDPPIGGRMVSTCEVPAT